MTLLNIIFDTHQWKEYKAKMQTFIAFFLRPGKLSSCKIVQAILWGCQNIPEITLQYFAVG